MRELKRFDALATGLGSPDELQSAAFENLKRHVLPAEVFPALTERNFQAAVEASRKKIPGLAVQLLDQVGVILKLRQEIQRRVGPPSAVPATMPRTISSLSQLNLVPKESLKLVNVWADELDALLPRNFLETIPFVQLVHLPRYLKALATRMERAKLNPAKDKERGQQLAPYVTALRELEGNPPKSADARRQLAEFRRMVEEFKVSLFAQELGTAVPVSPQRLDQLLKTLM